MHIPDGILPPVVAISSYGITGGITWFCLRQISKQSNYQAQIPKASLLTAALFNNPLSKNILTFFVGSIAVFLSALIFVFITLNTISSEFNIDTEKTAILTSLIGYGIQAIIEGILTVMLVDFFEKVKPEILDIDNSNRRQEIS